MGALDEPGLTLRVVLRWGAGQCAESLLSVLHVGDSVEEVGVHPVTPAINAPMSTNAMIVTMTARRAPTLSTPKKRRSFASSMLPQVGHVVLVYSSTRTKGRSLPTRSASAPGGCSRRYSVPH